MRDMPEIRDMRDMHEIRELRDMDFSGQYGAAPQQGPPGTQASHTSENYVPPPRAPPPTSHGMIGGPSPFWSGYSDNAPPPGPLQGPPPGPPSGPPPGAPGSRTAGPPQARPQPASSFNEEATRNMAGEVFDRFDVDKGGYLDLQEFMDALRALHLAITYHETMERFFRADHNRDGRISKDEFISIYIEELRNQRKY